MRLLRVALQGVEKEEGVGMTNELTVVPEVRREPEVLFPYIDGNYASLDSRTMMHVLTMSLSYLGQKVTKDLREWLNAGYFSLLDMGKYGKDYKGYKYIIETVLPARFKTEEVRQIKVRILVYTRKTDYGVKKNPEQHRYVKQPSQVGREWIRKTQWEETNVRMFRVRVPAAQWLLHEACEQLSRFDKRITEEYLLSEKAQYHYYVEDRYVNIGGHSIYSSMVLNFCKAVYAAAAKQTGNAKPLEEYADEWVDRLIKDLREGRLRQNDNSYQTDVSDYERKMDMRRREGG
jgi:hypothetical protein